MVRNILLVNEVKGITESIKSTVDVNVIRIKSEKQAFKVAYDTMNSSTIVVLNHKFEYESKYNPSGFSSYINKKGTNVVVKQISYKTSTILAMASILFKRGIFPIRLVNYKWDMKSHQNIIAKDVTIAEGDNLYKKINEFCEYVVKTIYEQPLHIKLGYKQPTEEAITKMNKYMKVYGLDPKDSASIGLYEYYNSISKNNLDLFMDLIPGTHFICPVCGEVVTINGETEYTRVQNESLEQISGGVIHTNKTLCNGCYEEYSIHDKEDLRIFLQEIKRA